VIATLLEAVLLVVLVVILFLQTWRASIIPLLAVPVSIIGTFAVLHLLGFSINTLTLFGLVLAIGIVVDDAIVVVENVERNIEEGLKPLAAAHQAMREVSGPDHRDRPGAVRGVRADGVPRGRHRAVLQAVRGHDRDFDGDLGINSLTLSPALAAVLLRPTDAPKDLLTRVIDFLFGWLFRPFNRLLPRSSDATRRRLRSLRRRGAVFGSMRCCWSPPADVPAGAGRLHPDPGQALPDRRRQAARGCVAGPHRAGGTQDQRHRAAPRACQRGCLPRPEPDAVHQHAEHRHGVLRPRGFRSARKRTAEAITAELNARFGEIQEGFGFAIMPPAILGIGTGSGYSLYVQDRAGLGYGELQNAVMGLSGAIARCRAWASRSPPTRRMYRSSTPRWTAPRPRPRASTLTDCSRPCRSTSGSAYINDFNRFGRTYQVIAQADARSAAEAEDIGRCAPATPPATWCRSAAWSASRYLRPRPGDPLQRLPGRRPDGRSGPAPCCPPARRCASSRALAPMVLPNGMGFEWTDLSYQQVNEGPTLR
jgi:multidrug efflux pump